MKKKDAALFAFLLQAYLILESLQSSYGLNQWVGNVGVRVCERVYF